MTWRVDETITPKTDPNYNNCKECLFDNWLGCWYGKDACHFTPSDSSKQKEIYK